MQLAQVMCSSESQQPSLFKKHTRTPKKKKSKHTHTQKTPQLQFPREANIFGLSTLTPPLYSLLRAKSWDRAARKVPLNFKVNADL